MFGRTDVDLYVAIYGIGFYGERIGFAGLYCQGAGCAIAGYFLYVTVLLGCSEDGIGDDVGLEVCGTHCES